MPLADAALKRQVRSWLVHDLPALAVTPASPIQEQLAITAATGCQELALSRVSAEATRAEARVPKTMSDAYPTMAHPLRRLCGVDDDAALPTFWREHAASGGKVALFETISQFRLGAADPDDILEGISPLKVCPPFYHRAAGTRLECNTYGMLTSGSGVAAMSEIRELSEPKLLAPRDTLELSCFVGGFSCLMDCLILADHGPRPVSASMQPIGGNMPPRSPA